VSQGPGAPAVGEAVPVRTLPDAHGSPVTVGGASAAPVLLVFVPFAFSRVCTAELGELQAHLPELDRAGVGVRAVSCDPGPALRAWAEQDGYTFPLLSDFWPHGAVAQQYGVFVEEAGIATRATLVIGEDRRVLASFETAPGQPRDFAAYRDALAAIG
jgi:peroxiredoxin